MSGVSSTTFIDWCLPEPDNTRCKHGTADCEACGSSNRRDAKHTTKNGRGAVGSLRKPVT